MKAFYYSRAEIAKAIPSIWFESNRVAFVMYGDTVGERYRSEDGEYWWRE